MTIVYKASAPGSLMLLGEYAVLYGKPGIVCAVDKRITVTLIPREDEAIIIETAHGRYATTLSTLAIEKPYQFVLGVLKQTQTHLKRGCELQISADFSDQVGFGSSAAVTVATLAVIADWLGMRLAPIDLIRQGRQVVRRVQGVGSGADIAAAVYGGIVSYQTQPLSAEKWPLTFPLTAWYAGYKTPTALVIQQVEKRFATYPKLFRQLIQSIGQCAEEGLVCLRQGSWPKFGELMAIQQGLMQALGVSNCLLDEMVKGLNTEPHLLGAKISGSGLGDCVIGLGEATRLPQAYSSVLAQTAVVSIPVTMSLQGVKGEQV